MRLRAESADKLASWVYDCQFSYAIFAQRSENPPIKKRLARAGTNLHGGRGFVAKRAGGRPTLSGSAASAGRPLGGGYFASLREVLDDLQTGPRYVVAHDTIGAFRIRSDDGDGDLVMFVKGIFRLARHELKRSKRCQPLAEIARDRG